MGRTISSFKIALDREQREWKPFRDMLDKSEKKQFDEMFDILRLYLSACSYSVHTVRLYLILMSILLHCHKQLAECLDQIEKIEEEGEIVTGIKEEGGGRKQQT